ncbi:hypothetical protein JR316_0003238 [Psilocybe cubensis]|uniref:Uncharacterized protein n=1 Tax=Psilocybe cubensis TaxID=181762 RepID=A0ACB8H7Z5_PSICU|nr:hypothetical protein JR316_0003238 [Psilocybe cubensis]KAH9483762.1 hypothetical protein JR316_0003238 [Psilocybe cubensis]
MLIVYQLLMTTVEATPKNAVKLREPDLIGSKRLGFTISQTKGNYQWLIFVAILTELADYLALESLLELFALLIPPVKNGRQNRAHFIKDVFDPSIFICSDQITRTLEDIANPDWSVTSTQILKELAESDITFPQPFEVSGLTLDTMCIDTSVFYIDISEFVANVDQHGKIETLHIPFSTISNITTSLSTLGHDKILITASVTRAPVLGDKPIHAVDATGTELVLSWHIVYKFLERFKQVMKHRKLMDRVQSLSQLWADKTPNSEHLDTVYSTPLVSMHLKAKKQSDGQTEVQETDAGEDFKTTATVFVSNGELTFHSIQTHREIRASEQQNKPKGSVLDSEILTPAVAHDESSEEGFSQIRSKPTHRRRRFISITDDDDDASGTEHPTGKGDTDPFVNQTIATTPVIMSPAVRLAEHPQLDEPNGSLRTTKQPVKEKNVAQNLVNHEPFLDLNRTKGIRKRLHDALGEDNSAREETRHAKNLRLDPQKLSEGSSDHATKKAQVSSTSSPMIKELKFDEIPRTTKDTKRNQMKGKNGKAAATGKRAPVKKADRAIRKKPEDNIPKPATPRQAIYSDPDVTLVASNEKADDSPDKTSNRRSTRVATIQATKKPTQKPPRALKKADKAPWEKMNFLPQNDLTSEVVNDNKVQDLMPNAGTRDNLHASLALDYMKAQVTIQNGSSDTDNQSGDYGQTFHDYIIPTKLGSGTSVSPSVSPVPKVKSDPVLIDLTRDVSPQKPPIFDTSLMQTAKKHLPGKPESPKQTTLDHHSTNDLSKAGTDVELRSKAIAVGKPAALTKAEKLVIFKQDAQQPFMQSEGDTLNSDAVSPEGFPKETSPLPPRLQIPTSSRVNIEKIDSYPETLGIVGIEQSPLSKPREAKIQVTEIKRMNVTADTYTHHHKSSIDIDLMKTKHHPRLRVHNSKQDWARTQTRISDLDDFNPVTATDKSPGPVFRKAIDPRSNRTTFEHKIQPMDKIISILDKLNED